MRIIELLRVPREPMNFLRAVVFSAVFAAIANAQSADLRVTLTGPDRVDPAVTVFWTFTVENAGPDAAAKVQVTASAYPSPDCLSEVIALAAGEKRTFSCASIVPP